MKKAKKGNLPLFLVFFGVCSECGIDIEIECRGFADGLSFGDGA